MLSKRQHLQSCRSYSTIILAPTASAILQSVSIFAAHLPEKTRLIVPCGTPDFSEIAAWVRLRVRAMAASEAAMAARVVSGCGRYALVVMCYVFHYGTNVVHNILHFQKQIAEL